jgi:hypothetical protein
MVTYADGQFLRPASARIVPAKAAQKHARRILGKKRAAEFAAKHGPKPTPERDVWEGALRPGDIRPWPAGYFCDVEPRPRTARRHLREKEEAERRGAADEEEAPRLTIARPLDGSNFRLGLLRLPTASGYLEIAA